MKLLLMFILLFVLQLMLLIEVWVVILKSRKSI